MPKYPLLGMTLTELQSVTKDLGMPACGQTDSFLVVR